VNGHLDAVDTQLDPADAVIVSGPRFDPEDLSQSQSMLVAGPQDFDAGWAVSTAITSTEHNHHE
jgi:hypothetical protein